MATGTEIITDAFIEAKIFAAETAIEPHEMQIGLRQLNDMMAEWEESGTLLGFTLMDSEADVATISRGAVGPVKVNLGARLASVFDKDISPIFAAKIKSANESLGRMTVSVGTVKVAGTTPKGAGNSHRHDDERFYPDQDKNNF